MTNINKNFCGDKAPHTREQAEKIMQKMNRKERVKNKVTTYFCPDCNAWHIGGRLSKRKRF